MRSDSLIQIDFPDISPWHCGNTGIPYVWTFVSGKSGPHLLLQAITHGNEVCGAIALDWLLRQNVRPRYGKLTVCFANYAAYDRWNSDDPYLSRSVDEDFNRLWASAVLDGGRDSCELRRARELRLVYDSVDYLLDIHSMTDQCSPLMLTGNRRKSLALAKAIGYPQHIVIDAGHTAGKRLRDYAFFDVESDPRVALLVECGQHWEQSSPRIALQTALRFLRHFELLDPRFMDQHLEATPAAPQRIIEVTHAVTIKTDSFRFIGEAKPLQVIREANSLLAYDGTDEIRTPYPNCVLVMPTRQPKKTGETAVRFGRYV